MDKKEILTNDFYQRPVPPGDNTGRIKSVNLMAKENAATHYTSKFELVKKLHTPIFRRGFPFSLRIEFNEQFVVNDNNLWLQFSFGSNPTPKVRTLIDLNAPRSRIEPGNKEWCASLINEDSTSVTLTVQSSPSCPVGIWLLTIVTKPGKQAFYVPQHMYILFNPWCKDDIVYMEKDNWREEYVLNDKGILYKVDQFEQNWGFKQFDPSALTAALYLLELGHIEPRHRGYPVRVCLDICDVDRNHILEGNWTGEYEDGTSPMSWTSSSQILHKFMKTKQIVKYGQCWCYAGIRTTFYRALGIPCRPTSIYHMGVNKNRDIFIDKVTDATTGALTGDETGNFHVFNDVWMLRYDLNRADGSDYGGWQYSDSGSLASLKALRNGHVDLLHGTKQLFVEISGIEVISTLKGDKKTVEKIDYNSIGNTIITKAIGDYKMQDVKLEYKFREGSKENKNALLKVATAHNSTDRLKKLEQQTSKIRGDVSFKILVPASTMSGSPIVISIEAENHSDVNRTMNFQVTAEAVDYRGVRARRQGGPAPFSNETKRTFKIEPHGRSIAIIDIKPEEYSGKLLEFGYVRIFAFGEVTETKHFLTKERTIVVKNPELTFKLPNELRVQKEYQVLVKFTNPLDKELTNCSLSFQATCNGIPDKDTGEQSNVQPHGISHFPVEFVPEEAGTCIISAVFNSKELKSVMGTQRVYVTE